jgi:hypothetical protein
MADKITPIINVKYGDKSDKIISTLSRIEAVKPDGKGIIDSIIFLFFKKCDQSRRC